ncbi:MAG: hypothetical protein AAFP20_08380 [Cyanobacteria bacterium J06614_10]
MPVEKLVEKQPAEKNLIKKDEMKATHSRQSVLGRFSFLYEPIQTAAASLCLVDWEGK